MQLETKAQMTLSGFAYSEESQEQFRLVNNLMTELKEDEEYSEYFKDIKLNRVVSTVFMQYQVTRFEMSFK